MVGDMIIDYNQAMIPHWGILFSCQTAVDLKRLEENYDEKSKLWPEQMKTMNKVSKRHMCLDFKYQKASLILFKEFWKFWDV